MNIKDLINQNIQTGLEFENPGGGTSIVVSITDNNISYKRKASRISLDFVTIQETYDHFQQRRCSTVDLRNYKAKKYSSKSGGHSCNCTFLFQLLHHIQLSSEIKGRGIKGNVYYVNIH